MAAVGLSELTRGENELWYTVGILYVPLRIAVMGRLFWELFYRQQSPRVKATLLSLVLAWPSALNPTLSIQ